MDDSINVILAFILGGLCLLLIVAIMVLQCTGHEPSPVLTNTLSAALGALLAFIRPPVETKR